MTREMAYSVFVDEVLDAICLAPEIEKVLLTVLNDQSYDWGNRPPSDVVAEFGVYTGNTIRQICERMPGHVVHGFDSFRGLPETWRPGFDEGMFGTEGRVPPNLPCEVILHEGMFDDTLPVFAAEMKERSYSMSLIHMDCDVYSSTRCVFHALAPFIHDTIVVFDEIFDYPEFKDHELLALYELLLERPDLGWTFIARGGERAAFHLSDNSKKA